MAAKAKKVDATRFEGGGISFKAKLIGIDEVPEARGDQMCQSTITKLKNTVKATGQHKQKILVNVTLEGLNLIDSISMATNQTKKKNDNRQSKTSVEGEETEKQQASVVLHTHAVHQISFISRDVTDNRAFGYVYGSGDGKHQFFAIKTSAAAEQLVLTLKDLFQVVYDMKKQQVDEAKLKLGEESTPEDTEEGNPSSPGNGSTSGISQAPTQNAEEGIYQVPSNNAPANPGSQAEKVANLLDLEDQADHILKGIEQIKNLEFDSIAESNDMSPVSPNPAGKTDPWGAPAASAGSAAPSSDLASLTGFNTAPFGGQPQAFPGAPFGQRQPAPGLTMPPAGGLPVARDPFGNDPFASQFQQPGMRPAGFPATAMSVPAGYPPANPFGGPVGMGQPFGMAPQSGMGMQQPGMMVPPGMMAGMAQQRMAVVPPAGPAQPSANPFSNTFGEPDPNVLQPIRNEKDADQSSSKEKKPTEDLFSDLVGMKKSAATALTPKDMFAQIKAPEKKSMNELKSANQTGAAPVSPTSPAAQASSLGADPFGEMDSIFNDKTRSLATSDNGDPFDTSHIPALPAVSPAKSSLVTPNHNPVPVSSSSPSFTPNAPPVPQRHAVGSSNAAKECPVSSSLLSSTSSSSKSSLSSSSALFPSTPFDSIPSITPPPLPARKRENNSSSSTPSHLPLNQESTPAKESVSLAFMLPSPDEPPPPLPDMFVKTPAAPPPPPRPAFGAWSSPSSSCSNSPQIRARNTLQSSNLNNSPSPNTSLSLSRENSGSDLVNTHSLNSRDEKNDNKSVNNNNNNNNMSTVKTDVFHINQSFPTDPFNISLKPPSNNKSSSNSNLSSSSSSSSSFQDPFAPPCTPKKSSKSSKAVLESQASSKTETSSEPDPFGIPLHLTPGFKAVAKFGSDPFEDSFHQSFSADFQTEGKWEAFPETPDTKKMAATGNQDSSDPWNTFGDPFASTQAPPVNGNSSGGGLLD